MAEWVADDRWDPRNPENRERTRELSAELRTLLLAWDPIGVGGAPEAEDEYDCLISPLLRRLHDNGNPNEIGGFLIDELSTHFGLRPNKKRERAFAQELVTWWVSRTTA
jgi:hypothetical protein